MSTEDDESSTREGAPTFPEATETAVIIPIASAENAVSKHRLRLDVAASEGVPAHVTVLFPFVPPIEVDDEVIARLAAVFAATSAFDCNFDRCAWFGDAVLWLAPDRESNDQNLWMALGEVT